MRYFALSLCVLLTFQAACLAHGGTVQPPPGEFPRPSDPTDAGTPVPTPRTPTRPDPRNPGLPGQPGRTRPRTSVEPSWRIWWELNREHLIGLRQLLRRRGAITGKATEEPLDPMAEMRPLVLQRLRAVARKASDRTLRAAAIIALGRMGTDADAALLLSLLENSKEPKDVSEGAAVALGILPMQAATAHGEVRAFCRSVLHRPQSLPTRARGLAILSTGLRARSDRSLVMALVGRIASGKKMKRDEAANLVYACGLSHDPMVVPELLPAVRKATLGRARITNLTRAHAALALGRSGHGVAARILGQVLVARSTDVSTRRSAALALGRLMREADLDKEGRGRAEKALLRSFQKDRDPVTRGFVAVALGGARPPLGRLQLMTAIDHGGNAAIKPFCALGLGLAARTLGEQKSRKIRAFLFEELTKTRQFDLSSSLSLALGLARATKAAGELLERLTKTSGNAQIRGAAAQGLGLMEARDPKVYKALEKLAVEEKDPGLIEDVVLALGLMGRRGIASKLVAMLRRSRSSRVQGRIILALGHLDSSTTIDPLLDILQDKQQRPLVREFAAVALGIIGDRRERDLLFSLDAYSNFYATTIATNELVRLY